jgi:hypothetical protein
MRQDAKLARGLGLVSLAAGVLAATLAAAGSFLFSICPLCSPYRLDETMPVPAGEQEKTPEPEGKSRGGQSQLPPLRQDVRDAG